MNNFEVKILRLWMLISILAISLLVYREFLGFNQAQFQTIDAQRINIREADGTLRMVISNKEKQDPGNIDGISIHEPGKRPAGMIFFNEQGDEMGGLIFSATSKEHSGGSLTFDRWKNDQTIQLLYADSKNNSRTGLFVFDRPNDDTMVKLLKRQKEIGAMAGDAKKKAEEQLFAEIKSGQINLGTVRVFTGVKNGIAQHVLYDTEGKIKLKLSVSADGEGQIQTFDKNGKVQKSF